MKMFSPKYNLYSITPNIFLLEIAGNNDLAYTFLRAQEFYESGNPEFCGGGEFTLDEYKNWYCTQSVTGKFTYGNDWKGFNLPSSIINECYAINSERTQYDDFFLSICDKCIQISSKSMYTNYYLIGIRRGDTPTLDHEIAHALFSTNHEYMAAMTKVVLSIPSDIIQPMYDDLAKLGYGEVVFVDEVQAYLSTGLRITQMKIPGLQECVPRFIEIFKSFAGNLQIKDPIVSTM